MKGYIQRFRKISKLTNSRRDIPFINSVSNALIFDCIRPEVLR